MIRMLLKKRTVVMIMMIAAVLIVAQSCWYGETKPWSFGVMGDTQWLPSTQVPRVDAQGNPVIDPSTGQQTFDFVSLDPEGTNPNNVSVAAIKQVNKEFIAKGVKFVIQTGDLTDQGTDAAIAERAAAAHELYDAGIGFFGMRGNHETYLSFYHPMNDNGLCVPAMQANFPQNQGEGDNLFGAYNFSSPTNPDFPDMASELNGLSYAFDYGFYGNNATFVILDVMQTPKMADSSFFSEIFVTYGYSIASQQEWISKRLDKFTRGTVHSFVFSHQPLMAANHTDSPFGTLNSNIDAQNTFYSTLSNNNVAYYIGAHDHLNLRAAVKSPDGNSEVEELIMSPVCPKFYASTPDSDARWHGQKTRQTDISEELNNVGYYIYTIDGPKVTVDYYSDATGNLKKVYVDHTPTFNFVKKQSWMFSLNGKSFMVPQGQSYTSVTDSFCGTTANVLGGTNNSTAKDDLGKALVKKVSTSWDFDKKYDRLHSEVLTLIGMADFNTTTTDTYALSMTCDEKIFGKNPKFFLAAKDANECFANAVDLNNGGTKTFVNGPYDASYGLGTYGVDKATNTVWAVVNYNGTFAAKK